MRDNVRKNAPMSPGITHEPTVCRIYGIKIIELMGGIIRKITSHKDLKSFPYDRSIFYTKAFDIVDWKIFGHTMTRVPHVF